jgi:hypothetical protein
LFINTIIGASLTGCLLVLDITSVFEHRKHISMYRANTRWRVSLLLAATFAFCVFMLDGVLVWRNWIGNAAGCAAITIPHVLVYFFQKQSLYHFLYDRAKIVHESLRIEGTRLKYLKLFRLLLWFVIVLGLPICFYWTAFVAFTGEVYSNGVCVFYVLWPIVTIIIAIADIFLELGMLAIFLVPLYAHKKVMDEGKSANAAIAKHSIDKVVRRNIIFSSIAMASCGIGLCTLAGLEWVANNDGTAATEHLRIWASFAIAFDNMIGVTAIHCMTSGWLPTPIRKRVSHDSTTTGQVNSSSPMNKGATTDDDRTKHSQSMVAAYNSGN